MLLVLALLLALEAAPAAAKAPAAGHLDPYSRPASGPCTSTPQPGTVALAQILTRAYGIGASVQPRACTTNQYVSDHARGLAIDWFVPAGSAAGQQVLSWLFAGDGTGSSHVRLRRLGISYIIWDNHIWTADSDQKRTSSDINTWRAYDPGACAAKYGPGTDCAHVKHMHISLGDAGGAMTTSWWRPTWKGVRDTPTGVPALPLATTPNVFETAFAADSSGLWTIGTADGHGDWQQGMMPGTSPAIATLSGGGYEIAYQAGGGQLVTSGPTGTKTWPQAMAPGTNPAITALPGGGFEAAFQASTGELVTVGDAGDKVWTLGMMPGTSPAIAAVGTGYEVAFQANTGHLWTVGVGAPSTWDQQRPMMPGTSPAITALADGAFEVAYQADTGELITMGDGTATNWHLGVAPGTSPAIVTVGTGFEVAFQADTGNLWTVGVGAESLGDRQLGMAPGTSPAIAAFGDGYEVAFQANTSVLMTTGSGGGLSWGLGMAMGTSPAIASSFDATQQG